jgi:hypothetical protein
VQDQTLPWWAKPGAAVDRSSLQNTGTDCPICGVRDKREWIDLYFEPGPGELRPLLGFVLECGHALEATDWAFAMEEEEVGAGFFASPASPGQYPVKIVSQETGNADIVGMPVVRKPKD